MGAFAGKTLMFVGGGEESEPGIERARELGMRTVVLDRSRDAPGMTLADYPVPVSIFDIDRAVSSAAQLAETTSIDGVLCVATDAPETVAAIADRLSLPSIGRSAAKLVSNKSAMKQRFLTHGVPTARGREIETPDQLRTAVKEFGGVAVVKPVDSRGARGVSIVSCSADFEMLFNEALAASPSRTVIAEEYLKGPQYSTESVVYDGRIATLGISTRNYARLEQTYPYPVEDGGELPAHLDVATVAEIDRVVLSAATALGITAGTVKGDIVISGGSVRIIELAGRLSGGYFSTHEIPLAHGIDVLALAFDLALGNAPNWELLRPSRAVNVAQRYMFPAPGKIEAIIVPPWIHAHPDVKLFVVRARVGDEIADTRSHPARSGLVITTGASPESAVRLAEEVIDAVEIRTVPV